MEGMRDAAGQWDVVGFRPPGVGLVDRTGILSSRNLEDIVQMQTLGNRLYLGLKGSGQWMRWV